MNEILQTFFFAWPWIMAASLPLIFITALVVGRRTALWWVAAYFAMIFFFPNASWGLAETEAGSNFYTRATGTFYFSAINIMLAGLAIQAFLSKRMGLPLPVKHNLAFPVWAFGILLVGNLVVGYSIPDLRWYRIIGYSGLLNVFNFMMAFYVLVHVMREPRDLDRLITLLLACVVLRGLWGLVRFAALGGDPANFYQNFQKIAIRLTFFDINDSLLAMLAIFIAGWRLANGQCRGLGSKVFHGSVVLLELFIIVFSYRRTAWGGLVLAALLFAWAQRRSVRAGLLTGYFFVGLPALIYKLVQRSGDTTKGAGLLERMLPDIMKSGHLDFTTGRFAELYAAWLTFKTSPIWGLGAWGRYEGFRFSELSWHRGDFSWMHSGMMHIILKTGLIGGIAVLALIWLYFSFGWRRAGTLSTPQRGIFLAGIAGVVFMLPTWLVGTPVIEYRTMQLLALCFALPYMVTAASYATAAAPAPAPAAAPYRWRHRRIAVSVVRT